MPEQKPAYDHSAATAFRPVIFSLLLAAGLTAGLRINRERPEKFSQIVSIIGNDYVDSVNASSLAERTIQDMLYSLDPHSSYIPVRFTEMNERQIRGNYQGLGIEYIRFTDTLFVFGVHPGGPAEKAGLRPGDRLLEAGGILLTDSSGQEKLQEAVQADEDGLVSVKVFRRSANKVLNFNIRRATIVMNSTEVYYMLNANTGYIRLDRFSGNTHKEFVNRVNLLKQRGMTDLVLDLRNNGGGLLTEATSIANEFLEKDDIISYTSGNRRKKTYYRADGNGSCRDIRLVLLINHNTASASEILAAAMQDNDRAVIVGNRSFGKGLVQEPFRLSDGSILRLTIARYYTPSGRSIQKSYGRDIASYRQEIFRRDISSDTLDPLLDSTQKKEFFSRNGRLLTSGGGIRPDIILRDTIADSTEIEMLMPGLFYSRVFDIYVLDYMSGLTARPSGIFSDVYLFQSRYEVSREDVLRFITMARRVPYLQKLQYSAKSAGIIRKHLKAALAYRLFGETGYSQIINLEEGVFSKSLEVLKNYRRILNIGRKNPRRFDY